MSAPTGDRLFAGSIPQLYDQYLVPLIFAPYAEDLARRVGRCRPASVLEVAAGTGAVTRCLAAALPATTTIVATDLNQPMLDHAARVGTVRPVAWQQADAMALPFEDGGFDAVVCQFGVMFFPDKATAFAQAWRVLRPGGTFFFNVWDAIDHNEFADCVTQALAERYPSDPPRFLARVPHGYHDRGAIAAALAAAGFSEPASFETVTAQSRAESPEVPAIAYTQGTPLRNEIEAQGGSLADAADAARRAIERRFGRGPVAGKIQALVVAATRAR